MTPGTVRLECRARPVNGFRIILVALGARQVGPVIERLERKAGVHVDVRNPGDSLVAFVAFAIRNEMARISACSNDAVVA